jgi:hypothetical protein
MGDNTKYTGLLVSQSLAKLGSGDRLSMLERPPRRLGVSRFDVMSKLTSASRLPKCTSVLRALSPMFRICNFCRPEKDEGSSSLILLWFKYSCSRFLSPSNPSTLMILLLRRDRFLSLEAKESCKETMLLMELPPICKTCNLTVLTYVGALFLHAKIHCRVETFVCVWLCFQNSSFLLSHLLQKFQIFSSR